MSGAIWPNVAMLAVDFFSYSVQYIYTLRTTGPGNATDEKSRQDRQ